MPGTAVLIEPRKHPAVPLVLQNFHENLPDDWNMVFFTSPSNEVWFWDVMEETLAGSSRDAQLKIWRSKAYTITDYNNLLVTKDFYEQFEKEHLLFFQTDSALFPDCPYKLEDFFDYDYVGAPWHSSIEKLPEIGGNGGLSLRRKTSMIEACEFFAKYPNFFGNMNEDIRFSLYFEKFPCLGLPDRNTAGRFSIETTPLDSHPIGMHKCYAYNSPRFLGNEFYALLLEKHPIIVKIENLNKT